MNEITTTSPAAPVNPFARALSEHVNAGTIEIESSRAIAEAQGKLVIAKRFPRNEARAFDEAMQACRRHGLADDAFWSYPRGKEVLTGSSIYLARELARIWGNIESGIRELSRKEGVSEMQAYAWDLQTNSIVIQNFTVRHWRDTKGGGYALTDERDIYEITANQGARRLRGCIFSVLPSDLVGAAEEECKRTLAGNNEEPLKDRVRKLITAFVKYGVTAVMIEARLGHSLDTVLPEELSDLRSIWNSLKSGVTKPGEWFGGMRAEREESNILEGGAATPPETAPPAAAAPPRARKARPAAEQPEAPAPATEPAQAQAEAPAPDPVAAQNPTATDDGDIFG